MIDLGDAWGFRVPEGRRRSILEHSGVVLETQAPEELQVEGLSHNVHTSVNPDEMESLELTLWSWET